MPDLFEPLRRDLERLDGTDIEIYGSGEYTDKRRTKVQDVAHYQNDGTERIKPARFVQKAAGRHRGWQGPVFRAIGQYLFKHANLDQILNDAGLRISYDINRQIDRIKTGRLKASMRPRVVERGRGGR